MDGSKNQEGFKAILEQALEKIKGQSILSPEIYFLIPVPDWNPNEATPLQGFSMSLCYNADLIRAAALLPSTIYDFTPEGRSTFLARRMGGINPVNWHLQSPETLTSTPVPSFMPFAVVLLGKGESPDQYANWVKSCEVPPVFVSEEGDDLSYQEFNLEGLQKRFLELCDLIPMTIKTELIDQAKEAIKKWEPIPERDLGYQVKGHGSVTPNLMALSTAGFANLVKGPFDEFNGGPQPYIDQIYKTACSIFDERSSVGHREADRSFPRPPDINLFAPTIYPDFFKAKVPTSLSGPEKKLFRMAKIALKTQSGYSFKSKTAAQAQVFLGLSYSTKNPKKLKPEIHPLMLIRQRELSLCTEAVGALAASEISTVLRLPNDINRTSGNVRQFAEHYRSRASKSTKRVKAFRDVQARLALAFPEEFYDLINRSKEGIRVISDAHLEWLDVGGLPLIIRKNLSRIPVTPGNLFISQLTPHPPIRLMPEDFKDILVITALARKDPIRPFFDQAFQVFGKEWKDQINVKFVEVSSEDELITALNEFEGHLVIFDGHGSHEVGEPAFLHLMDTPVDVWSLRGKLKRPPLIVLLSACDTHAADRNHATAANGFLSLGTRAVLGSVFPLSAVDAATFAARLIYRISSFVPAAVDLFDRSLSWMELVSGMLRMQLLTDFLRGLLDKKMISKELYIEVHTKGNMVINGGHEDPFEEIINLLVAGGISKSVAKSELEEAIASSSVISYIHMGRPETIFVDTKKRFEHHLQELSE